MRRRMGDNALQNKPPCRMTGSKKGVRFNVTPPYAHRKKRREAAITADLGVSPSEGDKRGGARPAELMRDALGTR